MYWSSSALIASFISCTLAIPVPRPDAPLDNTNPFNGRLDNGVVAFVKSFPSGGDWQLNYDDVSNEVNEITGGATKGITDMIKQVFGVQTNSKVVNNDSNQPTNPAPASQGTLTGRVYTKVANNGSEYLCYVQIGANTLNVNLDTGSSDSWVFSTALPSNEQTNHTVYNPSQSSTHSDVPTASFKVSYGDDTSLTGPVANDTVTVASLPAKEQSIALPTSFSDGILDDPSDGILGLGFKSLNSICAQSSDSPGGSPQSSGNTHCPDGYVRDPQPTWFETVKPTLKAGLFAVNFKYGTTGYFEFGRYDEGAHQGNLNYVPINNGGGYWQFQSRSYRVAGQGQPIEFNGQDGIADTGTSLLKLDQTVVNAYYAQVEGAKNDPSGWTFSCQTKLPDLEIALGSYLATVDGQSLNYGPTDNPGECYGGIQASDPGTPQIFGDTFFKSNFVVFDYDGLRIGVAPHA